MTTSQLDVAVVGAGIGGLALAQGLRRLGLNVAVYERDSGPTSRTDRYRLHIDPAGVRALRACLPPWSWRRFLAVSGRPGGGFGFLDDHLRELVVIEDDVMYPAVYDRAQRAYPIQRADLRDILAEGLGDVVSYGRSFHRYEIDTDGRVGVFFTDGSSTCVDVLIGADGAESRVARQLLPNRHRQDLNALGVGLKIPLNEGSRSRIPARLLHGQNMILTSGPFFLFTAAMELPISAEARQNSYLLCTVVVRRDRVPADAAVLDGSAAHAMVCDLIRQPALRELIEVADPDSAGVFPFYALGPDVLGVPGPVALIGDAIHLMPPTAGVGANTALRDAHLLSRSLAAIGDRIEDIPTAVGEYEAEMHAYGTAAMDAALANLRQGLADNLFRVAAMRAFLRMCGVVGPVRRACFRDRWADLAKPRPWEEIPTDDAEPKPPQSERSDYEHY